MRILQIHTRYREAGGEDAVVEAERELLKRGGHDVECLEFENPPSQAAAASKLLRAPWNSNAAATALEMAEQFRADIVHVHNTWFAASPSVFSRLSLAGFPTVATIHNYRLLCVNAGLYRDGRICEDCVGHVPWRGVVHRCYRNSAVQSAVVALTIGTHRGLGTWEKHVDVVISLTPFMADHLALAGVSRESIVVKPNVVPDPGKRREQPSSSNTVLFVGRLSQEKGIEDLLDAWMSIPETGLQLIIMGDGPLRAWADEVVRDRSDIRLAGRADAHAVAETMKGARALVLPSRLFEGMPMVLLEAFAAGLGAVIPGHGALPGIARDGGITYEGGSVRDLLRALVSLEDDRLVDALGRSARTNYEDNFSPSVGLAALEHVYEIALRRPRRQDGAVGP